MKNVGIITFHNSYNCGSMLESYAIQKIICTLGYNPIIIDYSSEGQIELYSPLFKNNSIKNIIKNIIIFPFLKKIKNNNNNYEKFKKNNFRLTRRYSDNDIINESEFDVVIAGSDQIWNITIKDTTDVYFLNWAHNVKKIAYAPSFGSKNILKYSENPDKYISLLKDFDSLSIRENNGQKWIYDMIGIQVPVLLDPTLLLDIKEYELILNDNYTPNYNYIFLYCPSFDSKICRFVKKVAKKYKLPVIVWSTKSYLTKFIWRFGFKLVKCESPSIYLSLIKNAEIVFTTSFHGTIFSSLFHKKFFVLKNGGMYGDDDRVLTLINSLNLNFHLIKYDFDDNFDYLQEINYNDYDVALKKLKIKSINYLKECVNNEKSK